VTLAAIHNQAYPVIGALAALDLAREAVVHAARTQVQADSATGRGYDGTLRKPTPERTSFERPLNAREQDTANKPYVRAPRAAGLPSAQFLTQQLAQMDDEADAPGTDRERLGKKATLAYRTAMGDAITLLGPVMPRQLVL
jgi:hypothetical protein